LTFVDDLLGKPDVTLDFLDEGLAMRKLPEEQLCELLAHAGSAWTISKLGGESRLAGRVDTELQTLAERIATQTTNPGRLLAAAWGHIFGRTPNPSAGYKECVRAVVAASKLVAAPNDADFTLGRLLGSLRKEPWKWSLAFEVNAEGPDRVEALTAMVALLWTGQVDRHGSEVDVDQRRPS
jgi:hypothetical protein